MSEDVDMDPATRQDILDMERKLPTTDFYRILGLEPGASADDVKRAYWELSKRYHPDRFFGKKLGSFGSRLDAIFRHLTDAQQTLTDADRREAYLQANPFLRVRAPSSAQASRSGPSSSPGSADAAREDERKSRLARHPYLMKGQRTTEMLSRARRHLAAGDFASAHNDLQVASQIDPRNIEVQKLLSEAKHEQSRTRAQSALRRAEALETTGDHEGALKAFQEAFAADDKLAVAAAKSAKLMQRLNKDINAARSLAQKAVQLDPKNADYKILWAGLLEAMGMSKLAKRQMEEAMQLSSNQDAAKKPAKKLR